MIVPFDWGFRSALQDDPDNYHRKSQANSCLRFTRNVNEDLLLLRRRALLRLFELLHTALERVDVQKHDGRSVDLVVESDIGPNAQRVPVAGAILDLAFVRRQ